MTMFRSAPRCPPLPARRIAWAPVALLALLTLPPAATAGPIGSALARALEEMAAPTPILYDRVLPLSGLERFDGRAGAAAADQATWRQAASELARAACPAGAGPDLAAFDATADARRREGVIALGVLDYGHSRIAPDAFDRGVLVVRGDRLEPGTGDPFVRSRVFAFAPLADRTWRGASARFALDPAALQSDHASPPARLELDLDDGRGARPLTLGAIVEARWATAGPKTLRLRLRRQDGSVSEAAARFEVVALGTATPDDTLEVTAAEPYLGVAGTGRAYVYLGAGHTAIVNPIVLPEGFDLDNSMSADELYALLDQQGLATTLRAEGFDAIVLDFTDATTHVQRNALVVAQLIREVEAMVAPTTTLAVVGPSMGGLCSRYALAWLETQGIGHRVRTWVSFDAPHGGADIPLGLQYWVAFFADQSTEAAALLQALDSPAARQMLLYHRTEPPGATGEPDALRAGLLADLAALGDWPAGPRGVAVANGSGAGVDQGFAAGAKLVQWSYGSLLVNITGDIWAVPDQVSGTIFDGRLRILFSDERRTVTVSGTRPWDGAPGGWRSSMAQMDAVPAPYGDIVALHPAHSFIPTVSALALETDDPFFDLAGVPDLAALTPFDAVLVPALNEEHVSLTPENAAWIRAELERGVLAAPPGAPVASALALAAPSPNPAAGAVRLAFTLLVAGPVRLQVVAVDGRAVARLVDGPLAAGAHEARWDGLDASGRPAPPGLYFVRLEAGGARRGARLVRLR
jgi:hypothetical protein